jgi:pimeloyl-ACP methyl ester carboxylesterase
MPSVGRAIVYRIAKVFVILLLGVACTRTFAMKGDFQNSTGSWDSRQVHYRSAVIDGTKVFYREAGPKSAPTIVLLHGFPTSSNMFRMLIPQLADRYHLIAPDYPGFGFSDAPLHDKFEYTFDHIAQMMDKLLTQRLRVERYALYLMDYGAPVGFRIATTHPGRVTALIVQNGNAYMEGLDKFWDPIKVYWKSGNAKDRANLRSLMSRQSTDWQYSNGVSDVSLVDPSAAELDQKLLDRPGNIEIQLDLFYDYRTNPPLYKSWQAYLRKYQPPTLVVWGKNDAIFVAAGAAPYKRDVPSAEIHLVNAGHFALETNGAEIAAYIQDFMQRKVAH